MWSAQKNDVCPTCQTALDVEKLVDFTEDDPQLVGPPQILPRVAVAGGENTDLRLFPSGPKGSSKASWMNMLKVEGGFYLPSHKCVTAKFMAQFLRGEKALLKIDEVRWVHKIWAFKELTVQSLMQATDKADKVQRFLPDNQIPSKVDRQYFLNVVNTVDAGLVERIVRECLVRRQVRHQGGETGLRIRHDLLPLLDTNLFPVGPSRFVSRMMKPE